jgi:hypothetical protein
MAKPFFIAGKPARPRGSGVQTYRMKETARMIKVPRALSGGTETTA